MGYGGYAEITRWWRAVGGFAQAKGAAANIAEGPAQIDGVEALANLR